MKVLITGGCGFLGSNLASEALKRGYEVTIIDSMIRLGASDNFSWLKAQGKFTFHQLDMKDDEKVHKIVEDTKPDVIFHTAGQVSMLASVNNPRKDFEANAIGTFNLLEAVRLSSPGSHLFYSSTNKVYGDLEQFEYVQVNDRYVCKELPNGFDETLPVDLKTPYGCSKGAADLYVLDYAKTFGLKTTVFRHSSIYGGRQFATADQGWIGWFVGLAIQAKYKQGQNNFSIQGNGLQVRDILFATDLTNCYFEAAKFPAKSTGQAFNIGGGIKNSLSLLELFKLLETLLDIKINIIKAPPRESDQKVFVADFTKATRLFHWKPIVEPVEGLKSMIDWEKQCLGI